MNRHRVPASCGCPMCLRFMDGIPAPSDPSRYCETYRGYRAAYGIPEYILETLTEAGLD